MTTALVLSGGAAQGSFEVGALQHLYQNGFLANIICSTSVGSVNALQLAHGGTEESQARAFDTLKTVWETALSFNEDMYDEAAWLTMVSPRTRAAISRVLSGAVDLPTLAVGMVVFPVETAFAIVRGVIDGIADLANAVGELTRAPSLFTLGPTEDKIRSRLDPEAVATSGVELRMVTVSLDSGAIRYVTQDGRVIETDGRPVAGLSINRSVCSAEREAYEDALSAKELAYRKLVRQKNVGRTDGADLRSEEEEAKLRSEYAVASANFDLAKVPYDQCIATALAGGSVRLLRVGLLEGVIASSSIPCVFPPTVLGDEAYVDGGIRWQLPLQAAVDFDPELIVAINSSPKGVAPADHPYRGATLAEIAERSVFGLELWETQEAHLRAARHQAEDRRQKVWIIFPRYVVHDGFTIDPGLIDINIAYGYMCAADVTTVFPFPRRVPDPVLVPDRDIESDILTPDGGPVWAPQPPTRVEALFVDSGTDPTLAALADAIARCRRECWEIEHEVFGQRIPAGLFAPRLQVTALPNPDILDRLRTLKVVLGLLVEARRASGGALPPGASMWADTWERHRWVISDLPVSPATTPWDRFAGAAGSRDAATRPNALVAKAPDRPEVYFVDGQRHWIPNPETLEQFGGWSVVQGVRADFLNAIPRGVDIAATTPTTKDRPTTKPPDGDPRL